MSELGGRDETLTLTIEGFERLHEVGERSDICLRVDSFVDGQNLFKLVLLLACINSVNAIYITAAKINNYIRDSILNIVIKFKQIKCSNCGQKLHRLESRLLGLCSRKQS